MEKQAYFWKGKFILNWKVLRLSLVRREQLLHSPRFSLMPKALTGNEQICFEPLDSSVKMQWLLDNVYVVSKCFFWKKFCSFIWSVGPLHSDLEYTITAQKEGFVLTAVEGTVGDFKAFALAGVTFEVMFWMVCAAGAGQKLIYVFQRQMGVGFWGNLLFFG